MATVQRIKQVEERNVASEITFMVWNDKMDLVALANAKGEVTLHLLTWAKAWSFEPPLFMHSSPKEPPSVTGIAWRPDGKVIAIAYSSGSVVLLQVEDKTKLHTIDTKSNISFISWVQERPNEENTEIINDSNKAYLMKYVDTSEKFLSEIVRPVFETMNSQTNDENFKVNTLQEQEDLNLLILGNTDGYVHVYIFGVFPCVSIDMKALLEDNCRVESVHLTEDLAKMFVTVKDSSNNVKLCVINSDLLKSHAQELFAIGIQNVKLMHLVMYLQSTASTITETWETILLELDEKLSMYSSKVAKGGVTADFLDLLMFGICSDEMREFLMTDLTKRGLEKFGQAIEMSYLSIQKLMLKYVTKFGQNVTYHLAELRGMARFEHRYKILGLSEDLLTEAVLSNGAFMIKVAEMQQIINHSITNYKAFFRWLCTAIMHLMEEQVPNDVPRMTQQDVTYIMEFLQNFDKLGGQSTTSEFSMERLGQYLVNAPLTLPPNMEGNDWTNFLAKNSCVQDHDIILKHYQEMSLLQQLNHLNEKVDVLFTSPKHVIRNHFKLLRTFNCFRYSDSALRMSQVNVDKDTVLFAFLQPTENVFMLEVQNGESCKCAVLHYRQFLGGEQAAYEANYNVIDVKFYSSSLFSVLLQENSYAKLSVLYQMPVQAALEYFTDVPQSASLIFAGDVVPVNASHFTPKVFKVVKGMCGGQFSVSGGRRVAIVLADNRRKVRLYEMEAEEDEDDPDMTRDSEMEISVQE